MKSPQKAVAILFEICALVILAWSIWGFHLSDPGIIGIGLIALASIPFAYPVGLLFMGLPFLMTISILYGVSACVLAAVPYAILGAAFLKNCSIHRKCFIFAFLVCNAFLYSFACQLVNPDHSTQLGTVILAAVVMTVVAFGFSFLAREKERRKDNVHLANSFVLAGLSAAIVAALASYGQFLPVVVAPLVGLAWGWNNINRERHQLLELLEKHQIPRPVAPQL